MARPPSRFGVAVYRRHRRRLLRSVRNTVVTPSAPASPSTYAQYVSRDLLLPLIMFSKFMILLHLATSMIELFMLDLVMFMIYLFQNLIIQLPNYSAIQKPYARQTVDFTMAGFVDALRPDKFTGMHFKRCQVKVFLWLIVLHTWEERLVIPARDHSPEERRKFTDANNVFVECVISVLHDYLVHVYMHITDAKELWDALCNGPGF